MSTGPAGRPARYPPYPRPLGEVPGYEFGAPRTMSRAARPAADDRADRADRGDPLGHLRPHDYAPRKPPSRPARITRGALATMLARNWVTGLALPILAAILVGVAAVVVIGGGGGGGGAAPSALDAGFPPARLAGTDFTGATAASPAVLVAIAASAGTEVAAGSAGNRPALWVSADGGSTWARAALTGAAARVRAGNGALAGVAHGAAGWLAVGTALPGPGYGPAGPIVASSPGGQVWTVSGGPAALPGASAGTVAAAVATGPAGNVIVGRQPAGAGATTRAVAWYSPAAARWRRAAVTGAVTRAVTRSGGAQEMNAVTATVRGFAAVGSVGAAPAVWLSPDGRTWRPATLPLPAGASHAAFSYVAANGAAVVAVGTEVSAAGDGGPFAEVSADGGATWRLTPLPAPSAGGAGTGSGVSAGAGAGGAVSPVAGLTVTALAAAGGGFTATGTYGRPGAEDVVVWTLPSAGGAPAGGGQAGGGWTAATPPGTGLAGRGTQAITALTAEGATLTGVGFTIAPSGVRQPTLWQSPIRD